MSTSLALDPLAGEGDQALREVFDAFRCADPDGVRFGAMMRSTLDQLYDGQRTGRYSWEQLHKTEKTHFGTLFEINLRREFDDVIDEGSTLDYRVSGYDVDCKFSQKIGGWMVPPEAHEQLLLVGYVKDADAEYAVGVVRASGERLRSGANRDRKVGLNSAGMSAIRWLHRPGALPPNVLLGLDDVALRAIFSARLSGQGRVNELFRRAARRRVGRNVVATVAQQADYMKRVRYNGGARSALRHEGFVILSGDYANHKETSEALGLVIPEKGEMVSARLCPAELWEPNTVEIEGSLWRVADDRESVTVPAPLVHHG